MLEYILLGFLNYTPQTGYDLKAIIDNSTGHFWHAYHSQIYTTLRKLEADGLLTSQVEDENDRLSPRRYFITDLGRSKLNAWLDQPLTELPQIKEPLLVRLFFSARRDPQRVLNELRFQRQLHQQQLDHYETIDPVGRAEEHGHDPQLQRDGRFWNATLEFGKAYESMYLDWLDRTIAWIEQQ